MNAPLPRDLGADITTFVTANPGTTRDHVADHFNIELDVAYTMLVDLVDLKQICSAITRQDGKTITVYRAPGAELPTIFEKALASAEVAAGGQPQTAEQKAIAFITANGGSATSDELAHVLGLKPGQFPSTWLAGAIKGGRINKNNREWSLGVGSAPAPLKPLVFNPAISTRAVDAAPEPAPHVPATDDDYKKDYKEFTGLDWPTEDLPAPTTTARELTDTRMQVEWSLGDATYIITAPTAEDIAHVESLLHGDKQAAASGPLRIAAASFAIWSSGELHIADGDRTVATLSREQVAEMLDYLSVFDVARGKK